MQKAKIPVTLYYGEEEFLIEEKIKERKVRFKNSSLNVEVLEGKSFTPDNFINALQTSPLLGGNKLVIVRDFKLDTDNQQMIIDALQAVPDGAEVIFQTESIDKRSRFYKLIDQAGETMEFRPFAPWEQYELAGWIKEQAGSGGKKISDGAARLLAEISGSHLRQLVSEIDKLIAYIGERQLISEDDVLLLASPGETSAFELLDALRAKDLKKALIVFQDLLRDKEDLFQLLSLLSTQYRLMLQIKALPGRERDAGKISRQVNGSPYFIKKCLDNIDKFNLQELKLALERLLETNLKMKTGESPTILFELLLNDLCGS
jgi:DNA polymerase-3 subunit delta